MFWNTIIYITHRKMYIINVWLFSEYFIIVSNV
jgi:hypothetical protein